MLIRPISTSRSEVTALLETEISLPFHRSRIRSTEQKGKRMEKTADFGKGNILANSNFPRSRSPCEIVEHDKESRSTRNPRGSVIRWQ